MSESEESLGKRDYQRRILVFDDFMKLRKNVGQLYQKNSTKVHIYVIHFLPVLMYQRDQKQKLEVLFLKRLISRDVACIYRTTVGLDRKYDDFENLREKHGEMKIVSFYRLTGLQSKLQASMSILKTLGQIIGGKPDKEKYNCLFS